MPFSMLHPGLFAFGIACVSIPIILHLLKRKRRPIPWGAMRFLEQAYRKRRRILTIEQLILLVLRCALLVLLALGVGSLMLGSGRGNNTSTTMVIVIDNSIGSALMDGDESSLDRNKRFALRAIDELDSLRGDTAMLITGGAPASGLVVPASSDIAGVRAMIERIEPTDSAFDLDGAMVLAVLVEVDPERPTRTALVIAASGRGLDTTQEAAIGVSFDRVISLMPETLSIGNVGITDVQATRSLVTHSGVTLPMGVRVGLVRSGITEKAMSTVRVFSQDESLLGTRTVRWDAGQSEASVIVGVATDPIQAMYARTAVIRVEIDDDLNGRDNTRLLSLATRSIIRVGVIDRPVSLTDKTPFSASRWVRAALAPDDRFGISILDIDASRAASMIAPNLDAIVVLTPNALNADAWDRISQLNDRGVLVFIAPDAGNASLAWIDRAATLVPGMIESGSVLNQHAQAIKIQVDQTITQESLLFGLATEFDSLAKTVSVEQSIRLNSGEESLVLAAMSDGSALGLQSERNNDAGMVVVLSFAIDLDWSNLPSRPMFVPVMQEIVRQGVGIGSENPMIVAGSRMNKRAWVVNHQRLQVDGTASSSQQDNTRFAGVLAQLDAQGATRSLVVINPDAWASQTNITSRALFEDSIKAMTGMDSIAWFEGSEGTGIDDAGSSGTDDRVSLLNASSPGVSIALWMILAGGVVAAIELVLAKLFTVSIANTGLKAGGSA